MGTTFDGVNHYADSEDGRKIVIPNQYCDSTAVRPLLALVESYEEFKTGYFVEKDKVASQNAVIDQLRNDLANAELMEKKVYAELEIQRKRVAALDIENEQLRRKFGSLHTDHGQLQAAYQVALECGDNASAATPVDGKYLVEAERALQSNARLRKENYRLESRVQELEQKLSDARHAINEGKEDIAAGREAHARMENLETQIALYKAKLETLTVDDKGPRVDPASIVLFDGLNRGDLCELGHKILARLRQRELDFQNALLQIGHLKFQLSDRFMKLIQERPDADELYARMQKDLEANLPDPFSPEQLERYGLVTGAEQIAGNGSTPGAGSPRDVGTPGYVKGVLPRSAAEVAAYYAGCELGKTE